MKLKILIIMLVFLLLFNIANATASVQISPQNPTINDDLSCRVLGAANQRDFSFIWTINNNRVSDSSITSTSTASILSHNLLHANDNVYCKALGGNLGPNMPAGDDTVIVADVPNVAPTAIVTGDIIGVISQQVSFTGALSSDSDGSIVSYNWNFGDGSTSNGVVATHSYQNSGSYVVTLTVTDNEGASSTDSMSIIIFSQSIFSRNIRDITTSTSSDFIPDSSQFLRGNPIYVSFNVQARFGSGVSDLVNDLNVNLRSVNQGQSLNLRPFSGTINNGFIPTRIQNGQECSIISCFFTANKGKYYYVIDSIPTTDNFLGQANIQISLGSDSESKRITLLNNRPIARSEHVSNGQLGQEIRFNGINSFDVEDISSDLNYEWTFGDGSTSTESIPSHSYQTLGTFPVTLRVTDHNGASDSTTSSVNIAQTNINNLPPTVSIINPIQGSSYLINTPINFLAQVSDPENDPLTIEWRFRDGSPLASGNAITHTYSTAGIYTATVSVNDGINAPVLMSVTFIISETLPSGTVNAVITAPDSAMANTAVQFSASNSVSDNPIASYEWNFRDGSSNGLGSEVIHMFNTPGTYLISLQIIDIHGNSNIARKNIIITPFIRTTNAGMRPQFGVSAVEKHSFTIQSLFTLDNKLNYHPGDLVTLLVRITNDGNSREVLALETKGINLDIGRHIETVNLGVTESRLQQITFVIPQNTNTGFYTLQIKAGNTVGDSIIRYLELSIN